MTTKVSEKNPNLNEDFVKAIKQLKRKESLKSRYEGKLKKEFAFLNAHKRCLFDARKRGATYKEILDTIKAYTDFTFSMATLKRWYKIEGIDDEKK